MNYYNIPKQVIDAYVECCEEKKWELFCLLDKYNDKFLERIISIDSGLQDIDLRSQDGLQGLAALLEYYVSLAKQSGLKHIVQQIQWALTMSRVEMSIGLDNDYPKLYDQQKIVYGVESIMRKNNTWYNDSKCYRIITGQSELLPSSSKLSKAMYTLQVGDFVIDTGDHLVQKYNNKLLRIKVYWQYETGWIEPNCLKEAGT